MTARAQVVVEATPEGYREKGRFTPPELELERIIDRALEITDASVA